jgi:hypothetical protein
MFQKFDKMPFSDAIQAYAEEPLNRQIMLDLLKKYKRPNDKISELIKKGELTPVKRGLYVAGPNTKVQQPEPLLIANHIWGPSYVSLETALSYWGFIPERVYETISVTIKSSKFYRTSVGRFRYHNAPGPYCSFGIKSVILTPKQVALIASPEKAICDKIVMTPGVSLRSTIQTADFLIEDMRIDEDQLVKLDLSEINSWIENAPKKRSIEMLVKTISNL